MTSTTAFTFSKSVYLLLWSSIQVEVEINSVERLQHYMTNIPQEIYKHGQALPGTWPESEDIQFQEVV